jgi:hypothetical protein
MAHAPSLAQPGLAAEIAHVDVPGPVGQHVLPGEEVVTRGGQVLPRREDPVRGPRRGRACHPAQEPRAVLGHGREGDGVVAGDELRAVLRHQEVPGHERPAPEGGQAQRPLPRRRAHEFQDHGQTEGEERQRGKETRIAEAAAPPGAQAGIHESEDGEGGERAQGRAVSACRAQGETEDRDRQHGRPEEEAVARREEAVEQRRTGQGGRRSRRRFGEKRERGQGQSERGAAGDRVPAVTADAPSPRAHEERARDEGHGGAARLHDLVPQEARPVQGEEARGDADGRERAVLAQLAFQDHEPDGHREDAGHGQVGRSGAPHRHHEGQRRQHGAGDHRRRPAVECRPHRSSAPTLAARRAASIPRPKDPLIVRSWGWSWQESVRNRFVTGVWMEGVVVR